MSFSCVPDEVVHLGDTLGVYAYIYLQPTLSNSGNEFKFSEDVL